MENMTNLKETMEVTEVNTNSNESVGAENKVDSNNLTMVLNQDTIEELKNLEVFANKHDTNKEGQVRIIHQVVEDRVVLYVDAVANRRLMKYVCFSEKLDSSVAKQLDGLTTKQFSLKNFNAAIKASSFLKQNIQYTLSEKDAKLWVKKSGGLKIPYTQTTFREPSISEDDKKNNINFQLDGETFNTMLSDGGSYRSRDKESKYGRNVYFYYNHENITLEVASCDDVPAILGRYKVGGINAETGENKLENSFLVKGNTGEDKAFAISHDDIQIIASLFAKSEKISLTVTNNLLMIGDQKLRIVLTVPLQKDSSSFTNGGTDKIVNLKTLAEFSIDGLELYKAMNYLNYASDIDVNKEVNKSMMMSVKNDKLYLNIYNNSTLSELSVYECVLDEASGSGETKVNPKFLANIVNVLGKCNFIFEIKEGGAIIIRKSNDTSKNNYTILVPTRK